jgi:hypothetical protein
VPPLQGSPLEPVLPQGSGATRLHPGLYSAALSALDSKHRRAGVPSIYFFVKQAAKMPNTSEDIARAAERRIMYSRGWSEAEPPDQIGADKEPWKGDIRNGVVELFSVAPSGLILIPFLIGGGRFAPPPAKHNSPLRGSCCINRKTKTKWQWASRPQKILRGECLCE